MTDTRDNGEPMGNGSAADRGASILLVDDHPENLLALEAILEPLGHRLVRATSGQEALRYVLREQFQLILLDVEMPGTDGLETARLIKRRTRSEHVPIIFVTALREDRRRATLGYESGAVDYLFKPFDPDLLRAKVAAFIEIGHLRDTLAEQQSRRFADLAMRESDERFRLVQQATNDVIWDWDLATDSLRWNHLAVASFGATPDGVTTDRWRLERIHPDDRDRVDAGLAAAIGGDAGDGWSAEYRFRLGDGTYGVFLDRAYVVRNAEGQPVRMIGAMQDVTERIRAREAAAAAQAAAERAREAAEEASRLKTEFLATMSHEFRTPLNAIIGYAQLLDMGVLGPATAAQHAHLERLQVSARHLLRLVDDVLDLAKVDADRIDVRRDDLMTGAAVAAAIALVQPQATAKGVRLTDHRAGTPGVPYVGDEHRVRQVLVNLLSNAVKFTPPGGEITIECDLADEPEPGVWRSSDAEAAHSGQRPWAFVRVSDTGPGIPPELRAQLFEPFVQGDSALTRVVGGSGLGLAISRRLARLMGGDVTVRSESGSGATFTLWLRGADADDRTIAARPVEMGLSRLTPALGRAAISEPAGPLLDDTAYTVLHALSLRLSADAESIAERYVAALRADSRFPNVRDLPTVQLRDHATPFIGLLASQLMIIGETKGQAPDLLADGGQVQRVMAELHGVQRHRLGWSEPDLERQTPLLLAEIVGAIHSAVDIAHTAEPAEVVQPEVAYSTDATRSAVQYAVEVARHMLERAARRTLRAYRFAKSAPGP
jgi:PAS domain S-box-containing protein